VSSEWITYVEAARVIGCADRTVARMVRDGRFVQRKGPRAQPSISAESARAVGVEVRAAGLSGEQRAAERAAAKAARWTPPPDGNVWLSAETTALVLGVTTQSVHQRFADGKLPFTVHGGMKWFRRSDVEMRAAVRAFQAQHVGRHENAPRANGK
jgi:hypothetical protein